MGNGSREPGGLYERLLAEGRASAEAKQAGESRSRGSGRSYASSVMRELEENASSNSPGYMRDLSVLHGLIRSGGPDNCASSMWFRCLKDQYPQEYEKLKSEHLGKGGSLQEGFPHSSSFSREDLKHLDIDQDLVFCTDLGDEYGFFIHEADVLLMALGSQLQTGQTTVEACIDYWRPYHRWCEQLYALTEAKGEEFMILTSGGVFEPMPEAFDFFVEASQYLPTSGNFHVHADDLGIPGAEVHGPPPRNVFMVESKESLQELKAASSEDYRIVLKEDISDYDFSGSESSPEDAVKLFEQTLLESLSAKPSVMEPTVYTVSRIHGLVFFPLGLAQELARGWQALQNSNTWEALKEKAPRAYEAALGRLREKFEDGRYEDGLFEEPNPTERFDLSHILTSENRNALPLTAREMHAWIPEEVQRRFGEIRAYEISGDMLEFPIEWEWQIVNAMEAHGYTCIWDDSLVSQACEMRASGLGESTMGTLL